MQNGSPADGHCEYRAKTSFWLIALLATPLFQIASAQAGETEVAISLLEFGGSMGNLLWLSHEADKHSRIPDANQYIRLATSIKDKIETGRASSSLIKANFDVISTTIAYASAADVEPMSKVTLGIAAWGAKKAGDAIGEQVLAESQREAQSILTQGFKESGFTAADLQTMSVSTLREKIPDLKIGGEALRQILKDDPQSLARVQAHFIDIATDIGVAAFVNADNAQRSADAVRDDLAKTRANIEDYQKGVEKRLQKIQDCVSDLAKATVVAADKLSELQNEVGGNSKAIHDLAQISFSGWSTAQKLQAVQAGMFPSLSEAQQKALVQSLEADQRREDTIVEIQKAASDFGNLATIAGNIGISPDVIKGLQGAQIVASGAAQFVTGNYLGAVASVTSLVGLGAPDAAAQRHAEMMSYLSQQFGEVNKKLDRIIELQVQTLKAIAALADEQRKFRQEVLSQLDRIETAVLRTEIAVQAILLNQWQPCWALIGSTGFNGQYDIPNRQVLEAIVSNPNVGEFAGSCYKQMVGLLDGSVKSESWAGQIIAALNFPADKIPANPALQAGWAAFVAQKNAAYESARDALIAALPDAGNKPAAVLARLSQPVADVRAAAKLGAVLAAPSTRNKMDAFRCNQADVLSSALADLICFGRYPGQEETPLPDRFSAMLSSALIGPQFVPIIRTGIALSSISDLAKRTADNSFVFPSWSEFAHVTQTGLTTNMRDALSEEKGTGLLKKLMWLAEANVLQQSITYGDFTAELAMKALYDDHTNSLDPNKDGAQLYVAAMRMNPALARNVVLLAMRRSTEAALGGPAKAEAGYYRETWYSLALQDFQLPDACEGKSTEKLSELFPNWSFEYRASEVDAKKPENSKCKVEYVPAGGVTPQPPEMGSGAVLKLTEDLYVPLPSPLTLSSGVIEVPDSLRLALAYRDKVSQALIDHSITRVVREQKDELGNTVSEEDAQDLAFALVNEGWGWQHRQKSN